MSLKEDLERIDSVIGRMNSAVHMTVRRSRTGFLDHTVKNQCGLAYYRYSIVQVPTASGPRVVHRRILVVPRTDTMLEEELGKSSYHHCSSLRAVVAAARVHVVHWRIHAGLVPGTMLVGLGLNNHRRLSYAHRTNNHNYSGSMKLISRWWRRQTLTKLTEEPWWPPRKFMKPPPDC